MPFGKGKMRCKRDTLFAENLCNRVGSNDVLPYCRQSQRRIRMAGLLTATQARIPGLNY